MLKVTLTLTILLSTSTLLLSTPLPADDQSLVVSTTSTTETPTKKENVVPILPKIYEMRVDTNVSNRFATTLVTSKVKNSAKSAQEATFEVILPEKAYISGFIMEIDGKSYKAYVKEKEEAKQIYEQAISSGQAAAHVQANARDSNRFTVSVNIEPQSKATFLLTYEELLQRQNEQYEIVINIYPGQPVKELNVEVKINETRPLRFVKTPPLRSGNEIVNNDKKLDPLAKVDVINSTSATIKFSPNIERQKQLANGLATEEKDGLAGQFVVQYDVERDPQGGEVLVKDGYFVHFFAPSNLTALPKHVVFVLDTSGSMDGIRIQQLKEAMNSILSELKKEDKLNIVEFSSVVKVWNIENVQIQYELGEDPYSSYYQPYQNTSQTAVKNQTLPAASPATEENVKKAIKVVEKLHAFGGTDIQSGLKVGLELIKKNKRQATDSKHQPILIFLTDGEPTVGEVVPERIISTLSEINVGDSKTPIFSLSFGAGADRDFLQKISLRNLGFARHIYEGADASLQLEEFYRHISSPLLSNVNFKYVSNVTKLTKTEFPIFFHGSELIVAGVLDEEFSQPTIIGWGSDGPVTLVPKIENPTGGLERHWAYLTVKQILEARDAADNKTALTKKALDLALKYSFVTPVSSLVVVKPNASSPVNTEDASTKNRPQFLPAVAFHQIGASPGAPGFVPLSGPPPAFAFAAPQPQFEEESVDRILAIESSPLDALKSNLPWLNDNLYENGTLKSPPGNYKLDLETHSGVMPDCPSTPTNGTAGKCFHLYDCPIVYGNLTSLKVYLKYFCPLGEFAGVCCPM